MTMPKLTLFDLDHTLLNGDSDALWCDFLIDKGVLDKKHFGARNADIETRYQAGTVGELHELQQLGRPLPDGRSW